MHISDAGGTREVDLGSLNNEAFQGLEGVGFDPDESTLSINDGIQTFDLNLSTLINDSDADPTNELIQAGSMSITPGGKLSLVEAGVTHEVDLAPAIFALSTTPWAFNAVEQTVHNTNQRIGIGTDSPSAKLEVRGDPIGTSRIAHFTKSDGNSVMQIAENRIQINKSVGTHIDGSLHYLPTILTKTTPAPTEVYEVNDNDHYIVVKKIHEPPGNGISVHTVMLPPAHEHFGRKLTIVRAGDYNTSFTVRITSQASNINYETEPLKLEDDPVSAVTLMSLGADGWIVVNAVQWD